MKYLIAPVVITAALVGCGSSEKSERPFSTSGSREADQRAEQIIVKEQQMQGEKGVAENILGKEQEKKTLYSRIGGEPVIEALSGDFVSRAIADPRVNWQRKGIKKGGMLGVGGESAEWNMTPETIAVLKKHIAQFLTVASGGPVKYEGKDMRNAHAGMQITNAQFDASVGAFKASMDKIGIPTDEQKELLAIVETTRPQVVEER